MARLTRIALPLLVFCVGSAAGAWLSINQRAAVFAAGVEDRLATSRKLSESRASSSDRAFDSEEDLLSAIMSALSEQEPLLRAHRLHEALASLDSGEFATLFARSVQIQDRPRRDLLLEALLRRWAAIDPAAVSQAVKPYRERAVASDWRSVDSAVANAWAKALPETSLAEALSAPDATSSWTAARAAMEGLADGDPARQLETLSQLPASRLRDALCESAIEALAGKDSAAAEARLDLVTNQRIQLRLQAKILGKLAEKDPEAGLARLAELAPELTPGTSGVRLVSAIVMAAAKGDADAALSAVNGLPEELQTVGLGAALIGWAGQSPVEALQWAATNGMGVSETIAPHSFDDATFSWRTLISAALDGDRAKTLAWVRAQPSSSERDELLRAALWNRPSDEAFEIYANLSPRGKADAVGDVVDAALRTGESNALQFIQSLPPGAVRKKGIQSFALIQIGGESEKAEVIIEAWPPGPDRDAALSGIVASISQTHPDRALNFARRISDPAMGQSSFERIAQTWLFTDQSSARAWLASTPNLSPEQKRVLLREVEER